MRRSDESRQVGRKRLVATVVAVMAIAGLGASADAGQPAQITPTPQTVAASASFSVTYGPCFDGDVILFEFYGVGQERPCDSPPALQGIRAVPAGIAAGTATATFNAPADPGTYQGIAYRAQVLDLQGFRRPAAEARVGQVPPVLTCEGQPLCVEFVVNVPPPDTTVAPTTSDAAVVPPAPPATAAPTLPATGPNQNGNAAMIAIAFLLAGGALIVASRWRSSHNPS